MISPDEAILERALDWTSPSLGSGHHVAIATVVDTWGSSPRPRGSQLVVRDDGLFHGSVSAGCVEARVIEEARAAMVSREHRLLTFGVSQDEAWEVGLACGGTIRIYIGPVGEDPGAVYSREVLAAVQTAREQKRAIVMFTPLHGRKASIWSATVAPELASPLDAAAEHALASDEAKVVETASGPVFVHAIQPPLRLVVVGAVHIAGPLTRMAEWLGYEVTIVDPREAFGRAERWPGVNVLHEWPDELLAKMQPDARTAVVTLTHDPKIDDPALEAALASPAFYVGALGSRKTHAARLARLAERGVPSDALARLHGPVGLRIGARSPAEIATSITAHMTACLRRAPSDAAARKAPNIAAVVLAAGQSRRMGGPNKLLVELDGVPIIRRAVLAILASRATPVFVVIGHEGARIRRALEGCDVRFVENPAYEEGLGASLRAGIRAAGAADAALVALGDMPWLRAEHVDQLLAAFDETRSICAPVHDGRRGHPVLWPARHFAELGALGGDVGARALLERYADAVVSVPVDDVAIHLDVDTPAMLAEGRRVRARSTHGNDSAP